MATIKNAVKMEETVLKKIRLDEKLAGNSPVTEALTKITAISRTFCNDKQELNFPAYDIVDTLDAEAKYALIETAENTAIVIAGLEAVIQNQIKQIDDLENQKKHHEELIRELKNIFASGEDSNIVQKEIYKIMMEQNKGRDFLKDKGADVIIQSFLTAVQIFLASKGII